MRFGYLFLLLILLAACAPPSATVVSPGLSGEISALQQRQEDLTRQVADLQEALRQAETRLQAQESALASLSRETAAQKVTPAGESAASFPPPGPEADKTQTATDIYLKAFSDYASGQYNEAAEGFKTFLQRFPANDFSGNAQFWLGECYYSQRLLTRAAQEFSRVVESYPNSAKAPDALLRVAAIFAELHQPDQAKKTLDLLVDRYPQSSAARKAREQR